MYLLGSPIGVALRRGFNFVWEYGGVGVWEKKEDYLYLRSVASLVWSVVALV